MAAPIYDGLWSFLQTNPHRFFMPGHKGKGFSAAKELSGFYPFDVTELSQTDTLDAPQTYIKEAQDLMARAFGSYETRMLVNGSSAGVLAMFLGAFQEGDHILIDRNCHRSVVSALILGGFIPVFIYPAMNGEFFIPAQIMVEQIGRALDADEKIKGVFLTSPNYFGLCQDIEGIAKLTNRRGLVLLVDEAHGAHFPFHPRFPKPAIAAGADFAVQSMHKTLCCPNQTALLHFGGENPCNQRVKEALQMVQTTSPSFPFLALMDLARDDLEKNGKAEYDRLFQWLDRFYESCEPFQFIKLLNADFHDKSRIVINFTGCEKTGREAARILEQSSGIYAEMADENNLVLIAAPQNTQEEFQLLLEALAVLDQPAKKKRKGTAADETVFQNPYRMRPKEAYRSARLEIPVKEAVGRICAQHVVSFPPCVPIVTYGEEISPAAADYLLKNNIQKTISVIQ